MKSVRFESPSRLLIGLMLAFCLAVLPWTMLPSISHPDERHYLTGAKEMLRSGDWITPRTATGELRFCKPGLTYWVTAVGMFVGGDNRLATRLPFIFMGCGVLAATAWGAVLVRRTSAAKTAGTMSTLPASRSETGTATAIHSRDDRSLRRSCLDVAALAAGIMATHFPLWRATLQSTPDIAQCLALVIATVGMIRFLTQANGERDTDVGRSLFWIGTAVAIAAKGLPGCVFLAYSLLFVGCRPHGFRTLLQLMRTLTLPVAAVIAAGWFVAGTVLHGSQAVTGFLQDQLTTRITNDPLDTWWQLPTAVVLPWLMLLPWSLEPMSALVRGISRWAFLLRSRHVQEPTGKQRANHAVVRPVERVLAIAWRNAASVPVSSQFILGWWLLVSGLMGFTETFSTRYALLTTPALAMLMANWFVAAANRGALIPLQIGPRPSQGVSVQSIGFTAAGIRTSYARLAVRFGHLSRRLIWLPAVIGCALNWFAVPDSAGMIATGIAEMTGHSSVEVTYLGHPHLASRLQQALPDHTPMTLLQYGFPVRHLQPAVLVCSRADAMWFNLTGYDHRVLRAGYRRIDAKELLLATWNGSLNRLLYERQQEIVVAVRKSQTDFDDKTSPNGPYAADPSSSEVAPRTVTQLNGVNDHGVDDQRVDDRHDDDQDVLGQNGDERASGNIRLVSATNRFASRTKAQTNRPAVLPGSGPKLVVPKTGGSTAADAPTTRFETSRSRAVTAEPTSRQRLNVPRVPLRRFRVISPCCGQAAAPQP